MHRPAEASLPATTARLVPDEDGGWTATADGPFELRLPAGPAFVLDDGDRFVKPSDDARRPIAGRGTAWVLPESPFASEPAWLVRTDGDVTIRFEAGEVVVAVDAPTARLVPHRARPHADVRGERFAIDLPDAMILSDALAGFYWGTMLPCVIERTVAAEYPDADGYVISTLADQYLGTYPDVDHEFQIKGRMAVGGAVDQAVVQRMIELQLRVMREDPQQLWRDPCAIQPNGDREYHVRRGSADGSTNAVMFLVTGNIEVIESIWLLIARTKDLGWLAAHIDEIEGATSCVEDCIDPLGRLWSDVYYEDQVIKDGRETMSSALAIRSFRLLAELEDLLARAQRAEHYRAQADRLAAALVQPLPVGYWDADRERFVDWVDRSGVVHDHIHLLANVLPVLAGSTTEAQTRSVLALVDRELDEFQRFPTFLAARVQDYTDDEIGDGGPYDLCAAGRYWTWDAAFWSWRRNGGMLADQLLRVARQGETDAWVMGERYDMDHVYYVDGSVWHGAAHYYEYPNVFAWVLLVEHLGLRASLTADLAIAPRFAGPGGATLEQAAYRLRYAFDGTTFELENLAGEARSFELDLASLLPGAAPRRVEVAAGRTIRLTAADLVQGLFTDQVGTPTRRSGADGERRVVNRA